MEKDVGHDPGAAVKVVNGVDLACEQVPCFLAHSAGFVEAELNGVKKVPGQDVVDIDHPETIGKMLLYQTWPCHPSSWTP